MGGDCFIKVGKKTEQKNGKHILEMTTVTKFQEAKQLPQRPKKRLLKLSDSEVKSSDKAPPSLRRQSA